MVPVLKGVPTLLLTVFVLLLIQILMIISVLKIDFKNAFNMIYRDRIISIIADSYPEAYLFVSQAYGSPSFLAYGENCIFYQKGVQQGDPLGPLLFSIVIQPLISSLSSPFNS